ncbi:major capsid protein [Streptosporangium sp. CA-115845]|uniref:major capsid protein n=1 Tax=Streptosporangium sp. CA-115845 TaxID=3240071 RepID=UPI003D8A4DFC
MERFELPDDITSLDDGELSALLEGAVAAFDQLSTSDRVSPADMTELRRLSQGVQNIRGEMADRAAAAEAAAAEIDALAAEVRGTPAEEAATETKEAAAEGEEAVGPEPTPPPAEPVVASAQLPARRPALDLSGVRRRQPRVLPPAPPAGPEITASVDVPGYQPGQPLDMDGVTEGIIRRANALKTAGGGVGLTASYRLPFQNELIINDSSSGTEGTRAVILASDQSRLPGTDLVASGGWCAPSETVYDLTSIACPEMLWDLPEIQLARGGLRYFPIPSLDVASMTFVHTEADDIAGSTKPCFRIPCPDPIEVRCDAIGVCLESGILTQRHFPELVAWYQRNVMVAHELRIRQHLFELALAQATSVTIGVSFGALSAVYAAIALQAADMVERHSLCDSINIEVTLPWWSRSLMLADLARQNGRALSEVRVQELINLFATLGVRIQWARGLGPTVPADIGGTTPAVTWPDQIQFLIYVAGSLQAGRGGEISLGVVHDSTKFSTNDYTALFSEECVTLINRGPDLRLITMPICPNGATAAQIDAACPIA